MQHRLSLLQQESENRERREIDIAKLHRATKVEEYKLAKLKFDNEKEFHSGRMEILRILKEKVEAADVSQAISAILK